MSLLLLAALSAWALFFFITEIRKGADMILVPDILPNINTPEHFGLSYEPVWFSSADGAKIHGWWIPTQNGTSDKTIVLSHGWGTNRGDILPSTWYLAKEGFNLFYFDFRGCGDSPRHGCSSLGYFEQRDLKAALDFVRREKAAFSRRLGLFGLSLGASVSLAVSREQAGIECAFLEAPFSSFSEVIERYIKYFYWGVTKFPFIYSYLFLLRWRTGFADHEGVSPWRTAPQCRIPKALLVYGDQDWLATLSDGQRLFSALKNSAKIDVEFWTVPEATHADCFGRYPGLYREKLTGFFKTNL